MRKAILSQHLSFARVARHGTRPPPAPMQVVVLSDGYDYFPPRMALLQIPNSLRNFTQPVTPADDRCDLSGVHELSQPGPPWLFSRRSWPVSGPRNATTQTPSSNEPEVQSSSGRLHP